MIVQLSQNLKSVSIAGKSALLSLPKTTITTTELSAQPELMFLYHYSINVYILVSLLR